MILDTSSVLESVCLKQTVAAPSRASITLKDSQWCWTVTVGDGVYAAACQ